MLSPLLLPQVHPYNNTTSSTTLPTSMPPYPHVVHRLSIPSPPHSPSPSIAFHPSSPASPLHSPFAYSWPEFRKQSQHDLPIDTFPPRRPSFDLSPTSSASSDLDPSMPYYSSFDAFFATQSRVVRVSTHVPNRSFLPFSDPPIPSYSTSLSPLLRSSLQSSFKMLVNNPKLVITTFSFVNSSVPSSPSLPQCGLSARPLKAKMYGPSLNLIKRLVYRS